MLTIALDDVTTHHDVPLQNIDNPLEFRPSSLLGVSKYTSELPRATQMDALLINKGSDILLVALHGATNREKKQLPRFEYMRTLRKTEYSSMYFSDPTLHLDPKVQLTWYSGWLEYELNPLIADWAKRAALAIGAGKVIFLGSSGGGFASLQVSAYLPGSLALPFHPQTSISNYLVAGTKLSAQRSYLRAVMPHLIPEAGLYSLRDDVDYFESLGERTSAILRYMTPQQNYVHYVQNINDKSHYDQHYLPFREAIQNGPNKDRIRFELQEDRVGHNPPLEHFLLSSLEQGVDWIRSLP